MWSICQKVPYVALTSLFNATQHLARYRNRLTVHVCTIAKSTYNSLLLLRLLSSGCLTSKNAWMVYKWSHLAWACRQWAGITTWLASESGNRFSYILCNADLKTVWTDAIWAYNKTYCMKKDFMFKSYDFICLI